MGIKLVALDLDGTILGDNPVITLPVLEAIRQVQAQGIGVVIATGRMHRSALPYYHQLQLTLPLISYQGALIKNPTTGQVLQDLTLPNALAMDVLKLWQTHAMVVHVYMADNLHIQAPTQPENLNYAARTGVPLNPVANLVQAMSIAPTKLLGFSNEHREAVWEELNRRYGPDQAYLTRSTDNFMEVTHPQANKGHALAFLAEKMLGLAREEVFAIGDYFNDLEMIRYAGIGVAMGTAPAEVQRVADWVAPTVAQDGVAVALEKFVL